MNFVLEPRHWALIGLAALFGLAGYFVLPSVVPVFSTTTLAFPLLACAAILDTLGSVADRRGGLLRAAGWAFLVLGASVALWPLMGVLSDLRITYGAWRDAGWPLPRAMWEAIQQFSQYPKADKIGMIATMGIGVVSLILAIGLPVTGVINPRIRRNRQSRTGPWQAGWMAPSDIAQLKRNKTGMPLALHHGKLLRYAKNDAKKWRGGHHLVVSGTRGGKGVSAVIPAILDHQGPVVALDIKGENFAVTRRHRYTPEREVVVLNPFGLIEPSLDQFNPLDYIDPADLTRSIDFVADGLVRPEHGDGAHFSEMARALITGAIEVIVTQEEPENRNLVAVADLLMTADLDDTLQAWSENADLVGHRPAQVAATILRAGDRERGSIQTSVSKAFAWMQSDAMRHFLRRSSFHMDDLLDDKLDLFIAVPLDQVDKQAVFTQNLPALLRFSASISAVWSCPWW